ncbi:Putrescine utilization regulator [Desulfurella amilsii]|uniref:Putrescine utilization regulator n=1 Tax=Desulfurella amilsii TaxID=1562698 RepID=A0A1X4XY46_9BACT|nr:XRE family transcriptional regulator [Desulfurella amilsii]OSS42466.1 Putrescine utilization regulator [Desulfurella amilsii]
MDVGEQIRQERKKKGFTLKNLGRKAGCSPNYLSLIEKNKVYPSVKVLKKILETLGIDTPKTLNTTGQNGVFVRKNQRTRIIYPDNNVIRDLLVIDPSNKIMEPAYKIIPPNSDSNGWHRHKGEEFGYILKGELELKVSNESFKLEEGDCFYFSSALKHYYRNIGNCDVETIWIVSPPSSFRYLFLKKH